MFKFVELIHNKETNFYIYTVEDSTTVDTPELQNTVIYAQNKFITENLNMFMEYTICWMEWNSLPKYGQAKLLGLQ